MEIRFGDNLRVDRPRGGSWTSIKEVPLLILVGLTGVGKSTVLRHLLEADDRSIVTLPDRRQLTDLLLIPIAQNMLGQPQKPVTDRAERFRLTRTFRSKNPGGMAEAIAPLWIKLNTSTPNWFVFDGLRGASEISYSAEYLPQAHFLALTAPDGVRLQRLLGREDVFDQIKGGTAANDHNRFTFPKDMESISETEKKVLTRLVNQGKISAADLLAKLNIVRSERENYTPEETVAALDNKAANRSLIRDTTTQTAAEIAEACAKWLSSLP